MLLGKGDEKKKIPSFSFYSPPNTCDSNILLYFGSWSCINGHVLIPRYAKKNMMLLKFELCYQMKR